MNINLWYSESVVQWRWTITDDNDSSMMESGNAKDLSTAMEDIQITIEWLSEQI